MFALASMVGWNLELFLMEGRQEECFVHGNKVEKGFLVIRTVTGSGLCKYTSKCFMSSLPLLMQPWTCHMDIVEAQDRDRHMCELLLR